MNNENGVGVHWSFWLIAVLALIWNVMGAINFFTQMNADALTSFPETHRAIIEGRPLWATSSFALSVFGGALGAFLLLFRKSVAYYLFIASLLGTIVTMLHAFGITNSITDFSAVEMVMMMVMPLLVSAFLVWYSWYSKSKAWIR